MELMYYYQGDLHLSIQPIYIKYVAWKLYVLYGIFSILKIDQMYVVRRRDCKCYIDTYIGSCRLDKLLSFYLMYSSVYSTYRIYIVRYPFAFILLRLRYKCCNNNVGAIFRCSLLLLFLLL